VLRMYITPFMTARMSVRRLPPPGFAGGINGFTYAHSSSVRSLGLPQVITIVFWVGSHASTLAAPRESDPPPLNPNDSADSRSFENGHSENASASFVAGKGMTVAEPAQIFPQRGFGSEE